MALRGSAVEAADAGVGGRGLKRPDYVRRAVDG